MLASEVTQCYSADKFQVGYIMRKTIIASCVILSGIIVLDSLNLGHALTLFLLAGVIPGTNYVLSPQTAIELCAFGLGVVASRLSVLLLSRPRVARYSQPKVVVPAK